MDPPAARRQGTAEPRRHDARIRRDGRLRCAAHDLGAANELSTLTSYHRLIAKTRHPELINLLNAIIKDERRHFAFYRAQARLRLARSAAARQITRWAMDHLWAIVGTGVRPQAETDFVVVELSGDGEGRDAAFGMDRTIGELPGMSGCETAGLGPRRGTGRRDPDRAPGMWAAVPA